LFDEGVHVMDKKRVIQWLIPALFGIAIGILVAWTVEIWLPGRDAAAKYVSQFGIAALLIAILIKSRTGYNWPWEGATEWADAKATPYKAQLRNFALWVVIVIMLLALFTLWQFPGVR
jgi:small-conductance mechanosensitive channel